MDALRRRTKIQELLADWFRDADDFRVSNETGTAEFRRSISVDDDEIYTVTASVDLNDLADYLEREIEGALK